MSLLFCKNLTGMVRERKDTDQKNTICLNNRTLTLTNEQKGQFGKRGSLTPFEGYPGSGDSSLGFKVLTSPLAIRAASKTRLKVREEKQNLTRQEALEFSKNTFIRM